MRIACWSGPRNLSTAMMYAFGARSDCAVMDEPYYAAYLAATGADHPMRDAILAAHEIDPDAIAATCAASPPAGRAHVYQKHMTHHVLPGFDRSWFDAVRHVFLIRHPARVLASYAAKRENPTLEDIGFVQQAEICAAVERSGQPVIVIDSTDIRAAPEAMLRQLCDALGIGFEPGMLSWPEGGHPADGIWAAHWYDAVHRSTGFAGAEGPLPDLPDDLLPVRDAALPHYARLRDLALKP